jgi:hypothetical protein
MIESFSEIDQKASNTWNIAGGEKLFVSGLPDDIGDIDEMIIAHRMGETNEYAPGDKYISDVLTGNDGTVPILDDVGNEFKSPPNISEDSTKEGFWYDMNRLQHNDLDNSNLNESIYNTHPDITEKKLNEIKLLDSENTTFDRLQQGESSIEGFGQNRSSHKWNIEDYPIITTNNLDMTTDFPQENKLLSGHNITEDKRLWGDIDFSNDCLHEEVDEFEYQKRHGSRIITSHTEKM